MASFGRRKGDDELVAALAAGATVRDAARRAGLGERTAHRRLDEPGFRQRVAQARAAMWDRALGQMARAASAGVAALESLLSAQGESVRLGAARAILELGNRLRESVELEQRLVELERRADDPNSQPGST